MTEKLLIIALKGGNTKIITLNGKKMRKMPSALEKLPSLKTLDLRNNLIPKVCPQIRTLTQFQNMKLREFYCEGNPLFLKEPFSTEYEEDDVWSLQEITSRFLMCMLEEQNPYLIQALEWYPQVKNIIAQKKTCVACGKPIITPWLECVQFIPPSKSWKTSKNLRLVPLRVFVCSHKCFNCSDLHIFGIAPARDGGGAC
ncbi:leucine-rich repeat-containing protein 69 isoform X2 [Otolemur garnettii]|uniref:leucine-rich repeat-containing protein 69 isoform X2 n=1 Tax=Otolemur garnettii TaxID=30611 RepID=UPI000C7F0ECA|nr:leucine-rich repeat-containing protein 69 isoform X2 [Otolemur garnettii]